ncbi:rhamnogalacturonan acetylesterase [Hymenobacter sp. BT770]|uniref:rhamnogalacturonan acetylesterase n=1 Tax=Hymenobacter sp. BT770 TaxID=2886942 RepID=UPI001D11C651|nr:rhamnogalacturonan acetylesterase [Hymenobacter sp. BT770]MCC3154956.1 rhamnogalacturonan acetylesterase [Hymenobacter sp. BT770]MDO3416852.1 rhamnogalacturonan acetylesterase [Hymenobacter sp. BT770]
MKNLLFAAAWASSLLATAAVAQPAKTAFKFDFGPGKAASGYQQVLPTAVYSSTTGCGFDFGTTVSGADRGGKDALKGDFVTSDKPFYFSVDLPEGNYNVTVTLGDAQGASSTSLRAESRRLLLQKAETTPGKFITQTFTVNIKSRQITPTTTVQLKPRELNKLDWDNKLTLEFNGAHTCLNSLEITPAPTAVTVFLAGNSTVVNQDDEPWAAWGQMIPRFFKPGVAIANHAESGLSLGSFLGSKRLDKVLSVMKPGDYLFIEFGHNDQKEKGPNDGAYHSYTERLRHFVSEARKKGGLPVIVTSTSRRSFGPDGKIVNSLGDYPAAARAVAQQDNVPLIDLNAMTVKLYEAIGPEESKKAFVHYPANTYPGQTQALADDTHFNPYGAFEIAKCIVEGIKANKLGLVKFLRNDTPAFDPAHPDALASWNWPNSPRSTVIKPDGN